MSINAHPQLPEFEYIRPSSLMEASQFLAQHPDEAIPFLGGTDSFVRIRDGALIVKYMVDVKGLNGNGEIVYNPQVGLTIGAAMNMNQVIASPEVIEHYPLLAEAARTVASYQIRTRATIIGNICNASPAGDTIGACMVYDGQLHVHGIEGLRPEPLETFFLGPGETTLKAGDIVTALHLPIPHRESVGKYIKLGRNKVGDLSIVGVTVLGYPDGGVPSGYQFRIALASVAPVPLRSSTAEAFLANNPISQDILQKAAQITMESCKPIDDVRSSSRYRKAMTRNLTYKALQDVWRRMAH